MQPSRHAAGPAFTDTAWNQVELADVASGMAANLGVAVDGLL